MNLKKILNEEIELILREEGLFGSTDLTGGTSDGIDLTSQDSAETTPPTDNNSGGDELSQPTSEDPKEEEGSDNENDINQDDPNKTPEDNVFDYITKIAQEKNNGIDVLKATKAKLQTNARYNNAAVTNNVIEKMKSSNKSGVVDAAQRMSLYLNAQGL